MDGDLDTRMEDRQKTKAELISEITILRQQIDELKTAQENSPQPDHA